MVVATQEFQYQKVPQIGLYVAATKALDETGRPLETGKPLVGIKWYPTKEWVQHAGLILPTSNQWSISRDYFQIAHPEIADDMSTSPAEWTDSLLAHPRDGKYASNLNNSRIPAKCKYILLIEGSTVILDKKRGYVVDGGEVTELPNFPKKSDYPEQPIPELGLIEGVYLINSDFSSEEGLRPVVRGRNWGGPIEHLDAIALSRPSVSDLNIGFRPAHRRLVETEPENDQDFVRVPRSEYESLLGDSVALKKVGQTLG
ncbi:MAG: hypothetical protein HYW22_00600 [Candidatus Aenigmarchaeota archaeon]|nr:hypothetical protein [Candidatus Aenigmarchaeota archaeon]